mmetsp:Transcript_71878/g.135780  ORF Transcript_71878/g.135780 Transcript_71878/m.135780 type:complete len:232 (-) Transcript_71878:729-1424(-)
MCRNAFAEMDERLPPRAADKPLWEALVLLVILAGHDLHIAAAVNLRQRPDNPLDGLAHSEGVVLQRQPVCLALLVKIMPSEESLFWRSVDGGIFAFARIQILEKHCLELVSFNSPSTIMAFALPLEHLGLLHQPSKKRFVDRSREELFELRDTDFVPTVLVISSLQNILEHIICMCFALRTLLLNENEEFAQLLQSDASILRLPNFVNLMQRTPQNGTIGKLERPSLNSRI